MRIAVVGAGAIGAYVGAMLARGGTETALVARGAHCQAMRDAGVHVIADDEQFTVHPFVTEDPNDIGAVDIVLLGLKAHQYAGAGNLLAPLMDDRTAVVAAQNGIPWWYFHGVGGEHEGRRVEAVDPDGAVSRVIPPERAIGCVVYCSTELVEAGVVRHLEGKKFALGEPDGSRTGRVGDFSRAMRAGGLRAPVVENIREHIWIKLMGNAVFNPVSALTSATLEQICRDQGTRKLAAAMMSEVLEVAKAFGVEPAVSIERRIAGAEAVGPHRTSMLQDLQVGKELELDALVTAVVELAQVAGVATPRLESVHALTALRAAQRVLEPAPRG